MTAAFGFNPDDPRRRAPRHSTHLLSNAGEVVDLSSTGMRIMCKGKPTLKIGMPQTFKIESPEGTLKVSGRVVWGRRAGFRKHEMGIEFVNVAAKTQAALAALAEFGFLSAAMKAPGFGTSSAKRKPKIRATGLPNYYKILGIKGSAGETEIHDAYRLLARKWHPDINPDPEASQKFIELREAYEVLRDPQRRESYDVQAAA